MEGITLVILRDKSAMTIFVSQLVSSICDKMMSIGLIWFLVKTYSISVVPWYLAICFLPHLVMAFFSTEIISQRGTLKVVIQSEFFRGIVLVTLFLGIYLFNWEGNRLLISLFVGGFLTGLGSSIFNPAILSLPP